MPITAVDRVEIIELAHRYNDAVDVRDVDAWVNTFTEAGAVESPFGTPAGRAALLEWITMIVGSLTEGTRHLTLNTIVDAGPEDGTAVMRSSYIVVGRDQAPPTIGATGGYTDRLRKIEGRWLFEHRVHVVDASFGSGRIG